MLARSRPAGDLGFALGLLACGDDDGFTPTEDTVAGTYTAATFIITNTTPPTDLLARYDPHAAASRSPVRTGNGSSKASTQHRTAVQAETEMNYMQQMGAARAQYGPTQARASPRRARRAAPTSARVASGRSLPCLGATLTYTQFRMQPTIPLP